MDRTVLELPFFGPEHRQLSDAIFDWASHSMPQVDHHDTDNACRQLVSALGQAGFLRYCVPAAHGGALEELDSRSLCIARETLAYHDGLADFAFAMQGLGTGAITLAGSESLKREVLPRVAAGEWIAAFALTEPDAGSDVGAMACEARLEGDHYVINGEKTWISNGGIADVYCLFARTGEAPGTRGISAFVVHPDMPGFEVAERLDVIAPHPLARLRLTREAAMAKITATENAQRVIDAAVQMHGGQGVRSGVKVESLYREIRALRFYEGATEVQKLIVARELLKR